MDPLYGYEAVNVEAQTREPSSLLNWTRRLLAVRKTTQALGRGALRFLKPGNRKVLAYLREHGDEAILCVANLGRSAQPVELDLARYKGRVPVEMLGRTAFPPLGDAPYLLTLPALFIQREFDAASFGVLVALSWAISQFTYAFGPGQTHRPRMIPDPCSRPGSSPGSGGRERGPQLGG
jgi:hypothetical protein